MSEWAFCGMLVSKDGTNVKSYFDITDFWHPVKHTSWVIPACEVRSEQASTIPVSVNDHGRPAGGKITYLERHNGAVWCSGVITEPIEPDRNENYYLSVEASYLRAGSSGIVGTDVRVDGAAIVAKSAMTGLPPMTLVKNGLDHHGQATWRLSEFQRHMLAEATRYRPAGPIQVVDEREAATVEPWTATNRGFAAPIEYRSAELADVSGRTVEIIAAPYNVEATVPYEGRAVRESFNNTAWVGVNAQENRQRIRVWLNHRPEHAVGRVTDLDPFDTAGLVAQFKLSRTRLGDETLELARDGVLDASVGFKVLRDSWEGRSRRRVTKAWLHHLGLTSDPAYDGTHVLAVRGVSG